jgi:hypothetical protein
VRDLGCDKKLVAAKQTAEEHLFLYEDKLKCFVDDRGKFPRHPRNLNDRWSTKNIRFFIFKISFV